MSNESNTSTKEVNVALIEGIVNLLSPEAKDSLYILSIPNLLSNSLAETLLVRLGNLNGNSQKVIEEIHSFPIWHYRTKISWAIDEDIRRHILEKKSNHIKRELTENVLIVLKENYSSLEDSALLNLDDYKIQILCLSSQLEKHVSEGISGFRALFDSADRYNQMEIERVIDLSLMDIFGDSFHVEDYS
jgi:hypothetical protein